MKIYFAGSVRGGRDDQELYFQIIEKIGQYGTVLTEHIGNKALSSYGEQIPEAEIYRRDMEWLMSADAVVAEVTNPSLGVGYEIGQYDATGRPLLCLYREVPGKRISAMLIGNPRIKVVPYQNMADVESILVDFFSSMPA